MSLTGFGEMDDMFGRMDRMMSSMMQSMMGGMDPMAMMNPMNAMNQAALRSALMPGSSGMHHPHSASSAMQSYGQFGGNHHHHQYAFPGISSYSSSVVTMTSDGLGRTRQVYEASSSTRLAPGGIRETQSAVRDSRTGRHEMSIGHHVHDRSHVVKKSKNVYTGQEAHEEDFVNVEEDEEATFERDWQRRAADGYRSAYDRGSYQRPLTIADLQVQRPRRQLLALPAPPVAQPAAPVPSSSSARPSHSSTSISSARVTGSHATRHSARPSHASAATGASSGTHRMPVPILTRSRSASGSSSERPASRHSSASVHFYNGSVAGPVPQPAASSSSVARPTSPFDQMRRDRRDKGKQRRERPY